MTPADRSDPRAHVPVSPVAFDVMLALAGEAQHGYAILKDIEARTGTAPNAGTLYRSIARLVEAGLVDELEARPSPPLDDARRRYYGLTPLGRRVATLEVERLAARVATARTRRLVRGASH
jgi:DNA-binding PadR family transcriptional regulator